MSLKITRNGILDTVQDNGRYHLAHLGINAGGYMDPFAGALANALLGNGPEQSVLELHYPAAELHFINDAVITITGGDFSPHLNGKPVPLNHPLVIKGDSVLEFKEWRSGSRTYIGFLFPLDLKPWLNSFSTNLKATCGGYNGRRLIKDDLINYTCRHNLSGLLGGENFHVLPWKAAIPTSNTRLIHCLRGPEWHWLQKESQQSFERDCFEITSRSDRTGYRLKGGSLRFSEDQDLVSSGVSFGTVQMLPDGNLIILMADHGTTGGYPRIAQILSTDLPLLAQKNAGNTISFAVTDLETAEARRMEQNLYLEQLRMASRYRIEESGLVVY